MSEKTKRIEELAVRAVGSFSDWCSDHGYCDKLDGGWHESYDHDLDEMREWLRQAQALKREGVQWVRRGWLVHCPTDPNRGVLKITDETNTIAETCLEVEHGGIPAGSVRIGIEIDRD